MKRYIRSGSGNTLYHFQENQPWSKRFYTSEYSYDGKSCPVSVCEFDNGKTGVVFYDEHSYIVLDENGKFYDSNVCRTTKEAKQEAAAIAYHEYEEWQSYRTNLK